MARNLLTKAEQQSIYRQFRAGVGIPMIAKNVGRPYHTVYQYLRRRCVDTSQQHPLLASARAAYGCGVRPNHIVKASGGRISFGRLVQDGMTGLDRPKLETPEWVLNLLRMRTSGIEFEDFSDIVPDDLQTINDKLRAFGVRILTDEEAGLV